MWQRDLRDLVIEATNLAFDGIEVSWDEHPQGVSLPGIVLHQVSRSQGYTQAGPDGLTRASVQVDVFSLQQAQAEYGANAVVAFLSGYRGAGTTGFFQGIFLTATRSGREGGTNEADRPFRQSMDFDVNWREQ